MQRLIVKSFGVCENPSRLLHVAERGTFGCIRRSEISRNPQERECFEKFDWIFEQKLTSLEF